MKELKPGLPFAIFDLDGCVFNDEWRLPLIDWPNRQFERYHDAMLRDNNQHVIGGTLLSILVRMGVQIVFFTAAPSSHRKQNEARIESLAGMKAEEYFLFCRQSSEENIPSPDLKEKYWKELSSTYNVRVEDCLFAVDDHWGVVERYAQLGLPAFVCNKNQFIWSGSEQFRRLQAGADSVHAFVLPVDDMQMIVPGPGEGDGDRHSRADAIKKLATFMTCLMGHTPRPHISGRSQRIRKPRLHGQRPKSEIFAEEIAENARKNLELINGSIGGHKYAGFILVPEGDCSVSIDAPKVTLEGNSGVKIDAPIITFESDASIESKVEQIKKAIGIPDDAIAEYIYTLESDVSRAMRLPGFIGLAVDRAKPGEDQTAVNIRISGDAKEFVDALNDKPGLSLGYRPDQLVTQVEPWEGNQDGVTAANEQRRLPVKTAGEVLLDAAETFNERSKLYKDNAFVHSKVMTALFPNGVHLVTEEDHHMWHMFELLVLKLSRFANSGLKHQDSIRDLSVYAAFCETLVDTHDIFDK